jgi:cobaltochelatase CobS
MKEVKSYDNLRATRTSDNSVECNILNGYFPPVERKILINAAGQNLIKYKNGIYNIVWNEGYQSYTSKEVVYIKSVEQFEQEQKSILGRIKKAYLEPEVEEMVEVQGNIKHAKYKQLRTCVENDIPVYLVGPAGSGKNYTLEDIAKEMELDFYFTNSVQQEFKITGFIDAGGRYHETEFYKAFTNGGLFFLDEMDASIPEVLVLLNAAIANKYFEFPTGRVQAHDNFRVVAAGNTVGSGADEQYTGRLVLDQATLDRFVIIEFDYDKNIEISIAGGNVELVEFVRQLRTRAKERGIRATFSYRCIITVTKLEGKLPLKDIINMAVFKGLDTDTINTLKVHGNTEYHKAI